MSEDRKILVTAGMESVDEMPKGIGKCDIYIRPERDIPAVAIEIKTSVTDEPYKLSRQALEDMTSKGKVSEDDGIIVLGLGIRIKEVHARFL